MKLRALRTAMATLATFAILAGSAAPVLASTTHVAASPRGARFDVPSTLDVRGEAALARVRFDWRAALPGWQVVFLPPRRGYLGLTLRRQKRIEIYVRNDRSTSAIAHDVAHELGHAVDVTYNDESTRAKYLELRQLTATTPWWTCNGCTDLDVGAGDFAETFSAWAAPSSLFYSRVQTAPSAAQLSAIEAAVYPVEVTRSAHAAA